MNDCLYTFNDTSRTLTRNLGNFLADRYSFTKPRPPEFDRNVAFAKEAMEHTWKMLPKGSSNTVDAKVSSKDMAKMRSRYLSSYETVAEAIANTAEIACKSGFGNCLEHTNVALHYLIKEKHVIAEGITIEDHVFAVLGRNPNSSIGNYKEWGESSVVCDPWGRRYYPASELEYHLNDLLEERFGKPPLKFLTFDTRVDSLTHQYAYVGGNKQKQILLTLDEMSQEEGIEKACEKIGKVLVDKGWSQKAVQKIIDTYSSRKFLVPGDPKLSDEDRAFVEIQLREYRTLENRVAAHQTLQTATEYLNYFNATAFAISCSHKAKRLAFVFLGAATFSNYCKSNGFFERHSQMYREELHRPWTNTK